ncbi:GDP-mannose 4,6-dehydratase [Candidatus Pelagibacter sp.]|jgi:UDP-glucose 4-epimerase|nr:GDP-mannose 4,6-dehydratase [Candidatus Pelagibacter sp.]
MRCLVTGGAGFIGSHLVEKLVELGHSVTVIDNFSTGRKSNLNHLIKKIKLYNVDISISGKWERYFKKIDVVFHLAALADIVPSIQNPKKYFDANVQGTFNILSLCKKFKIKKIIYSASSSCYGIPKKFPTPEESKIDPQYPYALTKRMGEELVMHWSKLYNLKAISLRFFNVYGTRSRTSGTYGAMFGVFLAQKIAKKPYTIVGDGSQTRDFTYVSDVVDAIIKSWKSNVKDEIFNVGSGKTISVNKIVSILGGKKVFIPKRPGEPDSTFADMKKIKKILKWKPKISIEQGIKIILAEINYWKKAPVWTPKNISIETRDWFKYIKN